jgi:hypothetical protein
MSRRKFSQTEAWNLWHKLKHFEEMEEQRANAWASEWPMGTHIGQAQFGPDSALIGSIRTARKLKHAVVIVAKESGLVEFIAMPLTKGQVR